MSLPSYSPRAKRTEWVEREKTGEEREIGLGNILC